MMDSTRDRERCQPSLVTKRFLIIQNTFDSLKDMLQGNDVSN